MTLVNAGAPMLQIICTCACVRWVLATHVSPPLYLLDSIVDKLLSEVDALNVLCIAGRLASLFEQHQHHWAPRLSEHNFKGLCGAGSLGTQVEPRKRALLLSSISAKTP